MGNPCNRPILVVDDEPLIRSLIARILERAGLETVSFTSADEARAALSQHLVDPRLALTDASMPGELDGVAFARWLHATAPALPIFVMSGDPDMLEKARSAPGVLGVLAKPFAVGDLLSLTAALLESTSAD